LQTINSKECSNIGLPETNRNFSESLGYKVEVEKRLGFKNVDVGFETNGKMTAVEVELGPDHLVENLRRDFEAGCEKSYHRSA